MKVFISGLSQLDFLAYFGGDVVSGLEWCEASRFVDALESGISATTPQRAVWLYRAPWVMLGSRLSTEQDSQSELDAWLAQQRLVLKSRQVFGDQLRLVNLDRVSASELLFKLGVGASDDALLLSTVGKSVSSAVLAKVFEWVAPSYWEIFESLESAAWLSQGEPIFRSTLRAPSDSCLFELLNVLQAELTLPTQQALLVAAQDAVSGLQQDLEMSKRSWADRDELLKENETLLLQLHGVQEELESVFLANEESSVLVQQERLALIAEKEAMASELGQSRELLTSSELRCAELQQVLVQRGDALSEKLVELERAQVTLAEKEAMLAVAQDSVSRLQQELAMSSRSQADRDDLLKENEILLLQLHQVQEDLEHYYSAHQSLLETAAAESSSVSMTREVVEHPKAGAEKVKEQSRVLALLSAPVIEYVKRTKSEKKLRLQMTFVEQSGFFDRKWYLQMYPDVVKLKIDPVKHYLKFGWEERRDPSARFSTSYYLNTYPDIQASGVNPLIHYIKFGAAEGRQPRAPWGSGNS